MRPDLLAGVHVPRLHFADMIGAGRDELTARTPSPPNAPAALRIEPARPSAMPHRLLFAGM